MSPKKSLVLFTAVALVAGGTLLWNLQGETPSDPEARGVTRAPEAPVGAPLPGATQAAPAEPKNDSLQLQDPAREPKLRIKTIRELKLTSSLTPEAVELVALVVSANPVPSASDPHSASSYQHQREAAVRVYALRRLSEELSLENFEQIVVEIEQQASDAALVNIAREALKAKRRGGNYFAELTQGIRAMPLAD